MATMVTEFFRTGSVAAWWSMFWLPFLPSPVVLITSQVGKTKCLEESDPWSIPAGLGLLSTSPKLESIALLSE